MLETACVVEVLRRGRLGEREVSLFYEGVGVGVGRDESGGVQKEAVGAELAAYLLVGVSG